MNRKKITLILTVLGLVVVINFLIQPFINSDKKREEFIVSVDPINKTIENSSDFDIGFFDLPVVIHLGDKVIENLASVNNAVNPTIKYVHITSGLRKEQIAERFAEVLNWTEEEKNNFIDLDHPSSLTNPEGYYFPGTYSVYEGETGESIRKKMFYNFEQEVDARFSSTTARMISLDTTLKIASLIEREAAGKHDMRLISGVIWNRMFTGMNLEIDATLQYAKGSEDNGWWPRVVPKDKYIDSLYNTYKYKGFPPTPIANPGLTSIQAALNPEKTDCLFYLHDTKRRIHCAKTYTQHKRNIAIYY